MATPLSFHDERPENRGNTNTRAPDQEYQYQHNGNSRGGGGGGAGAFKIALFVVAALSLLGIIFSMTSTSDFISHLDRQVHSIHCSLLPGAKAEVGESGCRTVMMSPYSSLLRTSMWGGIPISLLSVAVFAYMLMRSLSFALSKTTTKKHTLFLVAATGLPVLMSVIYGYIAFSEIGAACTVCIGIYVVSALSFVAAIVAHVGAPADEDGASAIGSWARWFGEGCVYVFVMVAFYVMFAPVSAKSGDGCGTLVTKDPMKSDTLGLFIQMSKGASVTGLAVLDPLCPACKGFDERIQASGIDQKVALSAVLFPLDSTCNWMVKESLHPGACAVSEAMLCDREKSLQILEWAFTEQERLRTTAKTDEPKVRAEIEQKFPWVKGCLGTAAVKNKVNKSLRFAVQNALPLLTPQLFIGDRRVCDEDTDLGLEYAVDQMLQAQGGSTSQSPRRAR